MQKFNADQLMDLLSARLAHGMYVEGEGRVCADSRRIREGDWFIAICGKDFDGHDFLGDVYAAGACGAIVEERLQYSIGNKTFPLLAVDNTFHSLAILARKRKSEALLPVVALDVRGSQEEINRLFDFTAQQLDERDLSAKIYRQASCSECLDLYLNSSQEEIFLFNKSAGADFDDQDFDRDWNIVIETINPEILIECKNAFAPDDSTGPCELDFSGNSRPYRVLTCSQNTLINEEIERLANKWQINPGYAGAVIEALDQEFAKV